MPGSAPEAPFDASQALRDPAPPSAVEAEPVELVPPIAHATWWVRLRAIPAVEALPVAFLLVAGLVGLLAVFLTPPGQVPDETNHFYRAWTLSSGHLIAPTVGDLGGGDVPGCTAAYMDHFNAIATSHNPFSVGDVFAQPACSNTAPVHRIFENSAAESPVAYAPQAVGIGVGRIIAHAVGQPGSTWIPFLLGRLAALSAYLATVFVALRITRRGRVFLFAVACLPISLTLAASFSEDGVLIGASILLVAASLRLIEDDGPSRIPFILAAWSAALIGLTKPSALPLVVLPLTATWLWRRQHRRQLMILALSAAAGVLLTSVWRRLAPLAPTATASPGDEFSFLQHHPLEFFGILGRTFTSQDFATFTLGTMVDSAGMFRTGYYTWDPPASTPMVVLALATLGVILVSECTDLRPRRGWGRGLAALAGIGVVLGSVLSVYVAAMLYWNPVGAAALTNVQGRYLLPAVIALVVPAVILFRGRPPGNRAWGVLVPILLLLVYGAYKAHDTFY